MKKYKTVTFGCAFSTKNGFVEKLQRELDIYSSQGWELHSFQVPGGSASVCIMVFEKEVN